MPPIHPALSMQQTFALIAETQSVQNLMRDAVAAIGGLREPTIHSDAVFTLGSIGVEKLSKILLGAAEVEATGAWPWNRSNSAGVPPGYPPRVERLFATAEANQPAAVATRPPTTGRCSSGRRSRLGRVSAAIAGELGVWWFVMHRLGVQGCFGELGKTLGWQIWEYGRSDPLRR